MVEPQAYLVLAKTADLAAFRDYYNVAPDVLLVGPYDQNLSNGGELVILQTSVGGTEIVSFTYQDGQGWPASADGMGYSIIPLVLGGQADGSLNEGSNWRVSTQRNGSPGRSD